MFANIVQPTVVEFSVASAWLTSTGIERHGSAFHSTTGAVQRSSAIWPKLGGAAIAGANTIASTRSRASRSRASAASLSLSMTPVSSTSNQRRNTAACRGAAPRMRSTKPSRMCGSKSVKRGTSSATRGRSGVALIARRGPGGPDARAAAARAHRPVRSSRVVVPRLASGKSRSASRTPVSTRICSTLGLEERRQADAR